MVDSFTENYLKCKLFISFVGGPLSLLVVCDHKDGTL